MAAADSVEADFDAFFAHDKEMRLGVRQFYRKLDKTEEWAENHYYHLPLQHQVGSLITVNAFWRDYAQHDHTSPFLSTNLAEASHNFPEMMFALALLDLPFEAKEHKRDDEAADVALRAASPMVVYGKQIRTVNAEESDMDIFVSQNFFRMDDRYRQVNNEQIQKFVTLEFLSQVVYGCQIVVTNPTSSRQKLDVLLQIPNGAIPLAAGKYTDNVQIDLAPYSTTTREYYFYFPATRNFTHFPVHVSRNETLIAFAAVQPFTVVATPSNVDTSSWEYISQSGSEQDVLKYMQDSNLQRTNLERIAWRMKKKVLPFGHTRPVAHTSSL